MDASLAIHNKIVIYCQISFTINVIETLVVGVMVLDLQITRERLSKNLQKVGGKIESAHTREREMNCVFLILNFFS